MSPDTSVKLIVIVGPTASGKTAAALSVAQAVGGEIICADSRTIYKGMDIGTAKPTAAEQALVPHHVLDVVEPGEHFSAAQFQQMARQAIADIQARGALPMLVGGTGLYIDSVIFDYDFSRPAAAAGQVEHISRTQAEYMTTDQLAAELQRLDPALPAEQLNRYKANRRHLLGAVIAGGINDRRRTDPLPGVLMVGINPGREVLAQRIRARAAEMFKCGVLQEAEQLAARYGWDSEAMTGNIYRIARRVLSGEISQQQAQELFITSDLQLAKRQMTWFKRNKHIEWFASPQQATEFLTTKCMQSA